MKSLAPVLVLAVLAASILSDVPRSVRSRDAIAAPRDVSMSVTNNSFYAFTIDGMDNPTLHLFRTVTYYFEVEAYGHPFYIKTARTTGSADQYTDGVTDNGVDAGIVSWTIPADAPSPLYYQCGIHFNMGGTIELTGPVGVPGPTSWGRLWLGPAAPNPARNGTLFRFVLPSAGAFRFTVFDGRGRRVRELANGRGSAGPGAIRWDGRDDAGRPAPSGVYHYRLVFGAQRLNGRVSLVR